MYWILATLAEACFGLGDQARADLYLNHAKSLIPPPADWMKESSTQQLDQLRRLLANSPLAKIV
jgi:hypothetical protein